MKFESHIIPPSTRFGSPLAWKFEELPSPVNTIYGSCMVGEEAYLFASGIIYVYNMLTKKLTNYPHSFTINVHSTSMAYRNNKYVTYGGRYNTGPQDVSINIETKAISQVTAGDNTNIPCGTVVDTDNNITYTLGGMNAIGNVYYQQDSSTNIRRNVYFAKRGIEPTSPFSITGLGTAYVPYYYATHSYQVGPLGSAGYYKDGFVWFACATPTPWGQDNACFGRYLYDVRKNTLLWIPGLPAFCIPFPAGTDATTALLTIPSGAPFKDTFLGVQNGKMYSYSFEGNSVDKFWELPDVPTARPNQLMNFNDDYLVTITNMGLYTLQFPGISVPITRGGVLEIYPGQQYRGDKELIISGKTVITPEWKTATDTIEIRKGEYQSYTPYTVYLRYQE